MVWYLKTCESAVVALEAVDLFRIGQVPAVEPARQKSTEQD